MIEGTSHTEAAGLSAAGAHRRDAMLLQLQDELPRVRRRRRAVRRAAGGAGVVAVVALAAAVWLRPVGPAPAPDARIVRTAPGAEAKYAVVGRAALDAYLVTASEASGSAWVVRTDGMPAGVLLDDEGLLRTLADIGRPSGLARADGRVWLTASVVGPPPTGEPEDAANDAL